jgi:glycosyltransferase involved in cell wall biosynthesis
VRILLVNGSRPTGGSALSTHAFARALVAAGHDVITLVRSHDHPSQDAVHEQLVDASVKAPAGIATAIDAANGLLGRRARIVPGHGYPVWSSPFPEHTLGRLLRLFEPAVVVGNSIERVSWRRCAALICRHGAKTALYLRESTATGHLTISNEIPDLLLANAESLVSAAAEVGHKTFFVPSVVELGPYTVESSRQVALLVNPLPEYGLDVVLRLAALRPDVPFVLQESWPLGPGFAALQARASPLANVEVRPRSRVATLYRDARVLLAPYRSVNRPRVVLEAQHNGVPVVATDLGGLREAVGDGGVLVPLDAPDEQWLEAFDRAWADPGGFLQARARAHAARPDVQPTAVVAAFEAALATIGLGDHCLTPEAAPGAPALSVVIPAHNAEDTLGEQLDALLEQRWDPGFEVIVADNLSTDATAEVVRTRMHDDRLRLVPATTGRGPAVARNAGVAAARADAIAFCDADDVVAGGWVQAMGEALRTHSLVAGRVDVERLNPPALARSRGLAIGEGAGLCFGVFPFAHSCNIGVRARDLHAAGGWDVSARTGQDIELCLRLWQAGVALHYEPSALVHYRYRGSGTSQWEQATRYGGAHVDIARRLEVRQLPRPSRLQGWRNMAWLVRHWPDALDTDRRPHWLWVAALRAGHIRGSIRWRTLYL